MQVGELLVKLGLDSQNLKRGLNEVKKEVSNTNRAFDTMKTVIAGIATGFGVVGAWKWLVEGNAQMEQYRQTLNIVMKDQQKAAETLEWAVKFAAKTPFEIPGIVEATVRLQAYGLEAKSVLGDIGDMASAMGKPLMQAVEAVADAQTGELERLKEFGITKQMLIDKAQELYDKEIVNAKGQITDLQGLNDTLIAIIRERYSGAMEAQSQTLNGMISNFKDWMETAGRIIGQGVFTQLKPAFDNLLDWLNKLTDRSRLADQEGMTPLEQAAKKVGDAFTALGNIFKWVKEHSDLLVSVTAGLVTSFTALKIVNTVTALMEAYRKSVFATELAQRGLNAAMKANMFGIIITALGALVAAGIALYRNWDEIKAKAQELWNRLTETFARIKDAIGRKFNEIVSAGRQFMTDLWNGIKSVAESFLRGGILGIVNDYILKPFFDIDLFEIGRNIVRGLWDGLSNMAGWIKDRIREWIGGNVIGWAKSLLKIFSPSGVFNEIGQYVVQGMAVGITATIPTVVNATKDMVAAVTQGGKETIDKIKSIVSEASGYIQNEVSLIRAKFELWSHTLGENASQAEVAAAKHQMLQEVLALEEQKLQLLHEQWQNIVAVQGEGTQAAIEAELAYLQQANAVERLRGELQDATLKMEDFTDKTKGAIEIYKQWMKTGGKVTGGSPYWEEGSPEDVEEWVKSGGGTGGSSHWSNVSVQASSWAGSFDKGGVVPGPIGKPYLAEVHGGEIITPPGKAALAGGVTVNIYGHVGVEDIGEEIVRTLRRKGVNL